MLAAFKGLRALLPLCPFVCLSANDRCVSVSLISPFVFLFLSSCASVHTAVAHLHRNRVAHNDISAENIMLSRDGVVKLIDFGAASAFVRLRNGRARAVRRPYGLPTKKGWASPEVRNKHLGLCGCGCGCGHPCVTWVVVPCPLWLTCVLLLSLLSLAPHSCTQAPGTFQTSTTFGRVASCLSSC